jgi:hypothetical protein
MIKLTQTVKALGSADFKKTAKEEIQHIDPAILPLQEGLSLSSYVGESEISVVILNFSEETDVIRIKTGVFYTGIIAGCSCSDDPSPTDEQNEYCELQFEINKNTTQTSVKLLNH